MLFLGDIVGRPGREAVRDGLPALMEKYEPDFVVANAENAAGGMGITPELATELFSLGMDALTLGNHTWSKKDIVTFLDDEPRLVRPLNFPPGVPGRGYTVVERQGVRLGIINLMGRVFSDVHLDCPFRTGEAAIDELRSRAEFVLVDMHADATSEKIALAMYLDGRVTAVIGTHTHVQTADERVLPGGTAFITDAGMCGPMNSVIGMRPAESIRRFLTQIPERLEVASGRATLQGVVVEARAGGRAVSIERFTIIP